jgi:hypothetical protein
MLQIKGFLLRRSIARRAARRDMGTGRKLPGDAVLSGGFRDEVPSGGRADRAKRA